MSQDWHIKPEGFEEDTLLSFLEKFNEGDRGRPNLPFREPCVPETCDCCLLAKPIAAVSESSLESDPFGGLPSSVCLPGMSLAGCSWHLNRKDALAENSPEGKIECLSITDDIHVLVDTRISEEEKENGLSWRPHEVGGDGEILWVAPVWPYPIFSSADAFYFEIRQWVETPDPRMLKIIESHPMWETALNIIRLRESLFIDYLVEKTKGLLTEGEIRYKLQRRSEAIFPEDFPLRLIYTAYNEFAPLEPPRRMVADVLKKNGLPSTQSIVGYVLNLLHPDDYPECEPRQEMLVSSLVLGPNWGYFYPTPPTGRVITNLKAEFPWVTQDALWGEAEKCARRHFNWWKQMSKSEIHNTSRRAFNSRGKDPMTIIVENGHREMLGKQQIYDKCYRYKKEELKRDLTQQERSKVRTNINKVIAKIDAQLNDS